MAKDWLLCIYTSQNFIYMNIMGFKGFGFSALYLKNQSIKNL